MNKYIPVKIIKANEPWGEIQLDDGNIVKTKIVIINVRHNCDEKGAPVFDSDGLPVYTISHHLVLAPERKPENKLNN